MRLFNASAIEPKALASGIAIFESKSPTDGKGTTDHTDNTDTRTDKMKVELFRFNRPGIGSGSSISPLSVLSVKSVVKN